MIHRIEKLKVENVSTFTVCNVAYLPKALVLADSLLEQSKININIFIFDGKRTIDLDTNRYKIHWIEDLQIPNFRKLAFKYDVTELTTALKPTLAKILLRTSEKVIFFDPDIYVTSCISPILSDLESSPFVLTPHHTDPAAAPGFDADVSMMRFGSFNLGFFAISKTVETCQFLDWWESRCLELCYFETQFGLSTDQKWVSIANCFFPSLKASFNLGYNVAFWNLFERKLEIFEGKIVVNNQFPLIFFHFSSFDGRNPEQLTTRPFYNDGHITPVVRQLARQYSEKLRKFSDCALSKEYTYDYFDNNQFISPTLRRAYAAVFELIPPHENPFSHKSVVYNFAKVNFLLENRNAKFVSVGFKDYQRNHKKFKMIFFLLRILLCVIGPNRFFSVSKLLVFISSFRLTKELWRIPK